MKVVIDLTKNFKTNLANKLLARYRRQLYDLYGLDFDASMTLHVFDYDIKVGEGLIYLMAFYVMDSSMLNPGVLLPFDKQDFERVFERIRQEFSLPKNLDLYRTLKGATIEYSPERIWLRLNISEIKDFKWAT